MSKKKGVKSTVNPYLSTLRSAVREEKLNEAKAKVKYDLSSKKIRRELRKEEFKEKIKRYLAEKHQNKGFVPKGLLKGVPRYNAVKAVKGIANATDPRLVTKGKTGYFKDEYERGIKWLGS